MDAKENGLMDNQTSDKILLAHGGGGQLSSNLIRNTILKSLGNETLNKLGDSAKLDLDSSKICFTTDSYVVKPLFFNGGDIGKLSVCGTINDLAVSGAKPAGLSLSLIIETGFEIKLLEKILESIAAEAKNNNVNIVTGDTKTVEAGAVDQIFINTAGVGVRIEGAEPGFDKIKAGDQILINGTIGDHGMTIISQRKEINFQTKLKSDCASLAGLTQELFENADVKFMRDPTRGGLATALNDIANETGLSVTIDEASIPIDPSVQAAADVLGFDLLGVANEGKFITVVSLEDAAQCLKICKKHPLGEKAAIIGEVLEADEPIVEMKTKIGGTRIVQTPYGRELPRIC
jgi:hydrogenase expression/formation protein HypE